MSDSEAQILSLGHEIVLPVAYPGKLPTHGPPPSLRLHLVWGGIRQKPREHFAWGSQVRNRPVICYFDSRGQLTIQDLKT